MCSSRKYPAYAPTLPTEGNGNSEGRGVQKKSVSKDCGLLTDFFPGRLSKIGDLLINNSLSAEQAISYFTVTGVALIIFFTAMRQFSLIQCHQLMNKRLVI